jgi:hypothetical protein
MSPASDYDSSTYGKPGSVTSMISLHNRDVEPRPSPDPNALVLHSQAERSVRALLKEGESANTVRSYASALRYWSAWFRLRYRTALTLPLPVPVVLQFLVDHVQRTDPDHGTLVHDLPPAIDAALVQAGFKGTLGAPALNTVLHRLSVLSRHRRH